VVDDGSVDGGSDLIADLVADGRVQLIQHTTNRGKGAAIRTGLTHAEGDLFTVLDGDLESDPNDLKTLLAAILEENLRVVYGKRSFGSHNAYSFWFVMGNRFLGLFTSMLFNTWITDIETCFKMAETGLWRSLDLRSNGFGIEAEITGKLLRGGHVIHEIPIQYKPRTRREGKKIKWTDGIFAVLVLVGTRLKGKRTTRPEK